MPEIIDTAFVRIRPEAVGFRQDAARQITSQLAGVQATVTGSGAAARRAAGDFTHFERGLLLTEARALGLRSVLGGVSTLFVGGAGLATVMHVAIDEFRNFTTVAATTQAILRSTGAAAHVTAAGVAALATSIEHKTGIDDEQIKSAENVLLTYRGVRNEVGRGNDVFDRATRSAADLSRVFGGDVTSAARSLGIALQDPERGLLRLRRAGIIFTADQQRQIKALFDTGQVLKAQTLILDEVDRRVGGTAESIGRTLPGQLNILRERAKDALGEYVQRLSQSREAANAAAQGGAILAGGFHVAEGAVRTLGPLLVDTAKAANQVVTSVGAPTLIAAAVGYKAIGVSVGLAARAEAVYTKVAAIAAGSNAAQAGAATDATVALRAETAALTGLTVATRGYVTASGIAVVENDRVAVSAARAGFAARAQAAATGAGRLAFAAIGGEMGAAAIAAGGIAAGLLLVRRAADRAAGGIIATRKALDDFDASAGRTQALRSRISDTRDQIKAARDLQVSATEALADAQRRQQRSTAAPGSLEARALAQQVSTARANLTRATNDLATAEGRLGNLQADQFQQQQRQPGIVAETTRRILEQIAAIRHQTTLKPAQFSGLGIPTDLQPDAAGRERALQRFIDLTDKLRESGSRVDRVVGGALGRIAASVHALPSQKQIEIVLTLAGEGRNLQQILDRIGATRAHQGEDVATSAAAIQARTQGAAAAIRENEALQQQFAAAQKILAAERKILTTRKEALATAQNEESAAKNALQNAVETLSSAREQLVAAQQALTDTIRAGQDAVNNSVRDAKSNLRSIGDSIAEAIGRFADQGAEKIGPRGPLGRRFRELRDQIIAGQGGPDTQRAAAEVAARIQQQGTGGTDDAAAKAKQRLDDLSDSFNRGRIGAGQFNQGVQRVLHDFGVNLRQFGNRFGSAALHDLQDEIRAAGGQARAIAAGPRRPGGGLEPAIVRPLDAVAQAQRDTRNATRDVAHATQDVARAQRELGQKTLAEQKTQTAELRAIKKELVIANRVQRQQDRLRKPKPTGRAGQTAGDLTHAGAGSP